MLKLGVNIDHVATIRQARGADEPDPVWAASEAQLGGADNITFHLREDRRHVNDRDAELLVRTVACRSNLEMSIAEDIVKLAVRLKPDQCTLVPERRQELTTEGGLDVVKFAAKLKKVVGRLRRAGCDVSAFIEPDERQIIASADAGFDAVELWTGGYAHAKPGAVRERELDRIAAAIEVGLDHGLTVHAGHGLTYRNVEELAALPGMTEFNIGHSIVSRAVFVGLREAVREMKRLMDRGAGRVLALVSPDAAFDPDVQ